jgi:hypothetical protein
LKVRFLPRSPYFQEVTEPYLPFHLPLVLTCSQTFREGKTHYLSVGLDHVCRSCITIRVHGGTDVCMTHEPLLLTQLLFDREIEQLQKARALLTLDTVKVCGDARVNIFQMEAHSEIGASPSAPGQGPVASRNFSGVEQRISAPPIYLPKNAAVFATRIVLLRRRINPPNS